MSTIFDALKKASRESKPHVSEPTTQELEDRLYNIADQARGNASSPLTQRPMFLIGGIVVIVAAVILVVSLVVPLFQRSEHTRPAVGLQDEGQARVLPPVGEPVEPPPPSQRTTEDIRSEARMLTVADLTGKPELQAASVPQQNVQPPTIIKINLQALPPAAPTPLPRSAPAVPVASTPSLPAETAPAQQVAQHPSPQPASSSSEEPTKESPAPAAEVSATPVREEGKTFGLELEGIVWDKAMPMAMINGRIVEEGDKIEGVRIVKIHKISVEIEKDGKSYSIKY